MEEEARRQSLCRQLGITDTSLFFLLLLIVSVVLSYIAVGVQREALCRTIAGNPGERPCVFPIRITASALVVGALIFFFGVAQDAYRTACAGEDVVAKHSASMNLWASLLVLAAALIRLFDLNYVSRCQSALEGQDDLPA